MNQVLEELVYEVNPANDFNGWRDGTRTSRELLTYLLSILSTKYREAHF